MFGLYEHLAGLLRHFLGKNQLLEAGAVVFVRTMRGAGNFFPVALYGNIRADFRRL
jgi:hypothetical protein